MKTETRKTINGLDVEKMHATINAIVDQPSLAQFKFRAKNQWISGGANRSRIQDFYGAGREDDSRTEPFEFTAGEPPILLGNNEGANPVEFLLHAVAGCLTTTIVLHAAARGIEIQELSTELEGDIDVQGLLALDPDANPGYKEIRIKVHAKADCSDEELDELIAFSKAHSPTCNTVCRPIPIHVERVVPAVA